MSLGRLRSRCGALGSGIGSHSRWADGDVEGEALSPIELSKADGMDRQTGCSRRDRSYG